MFFSQHSPTRKKKKNLMKKWFFKKYVAGLQEAHKKMLNIINY